MDLLGPPQDWWRDALCAEYPEHEAAFFPERHQGHLMDLAKGICASCLVREECVDYALHHDIDHGIWGGTSARERRRLRRSLVDEAA